MDIQVGLETDSLSPKATGLSNTTRVTAVIVNLFHSLSLVLPGPRCGHSLLFTIIACLILLVPGSRLSAATDAAQEKDLGKAASLEEMRLRVAAASAISPPWDGPRLGPNAKIGRTIAIINEDLRNGGILGVAQGVREAAKVLGWKVEMFDAGGTQEGRKEAAARALRADPDGVLLNGADAKIMAPWLAPFTKREIPVVGWHVGPTAGKMTEGAVAMNVSTDPLEVARITAMAAIVAAQGRAGVIIFTDSNFEIALAKSDAMAEVIRRCQGCTLLEVRDVAISDSAQLMPSVSRELLDRYGDRWTHALAINDIYFDHAVPEFILAGPAAQHIDLLSAGDGSSAAYVRIQAGAFQVGTVAEPLNLHGWQLVDELNRLMEHQPVSGYVASVHLITPENVEYDGGLEYHYDPANGYRNVYRRIWGR